MHLLSLIDFKWLFKPYIWVCVLYLFYFQNILNTGFNQMLF